MSFGGFEGDIAPWKKWNYRLKVIGEMSVGYNNTVEAFGRAKTVELFKVRECEFGIDGFYGDVVFENIDAGNKVLDKLGFPEIGITAKQIHLVNSEFLEKNFPGKEVSGKVFHGHAYIDSALSGLEAIVVLTHEIAHLFSYEALRIIVSGDEGSDKNIGLLQLGLTFFPKNGLPQETLYDAVSELLTELFACRVRKLTMLERHHEVSECHPYFEYVEYFRKILRKIAGSEASFIKLENNFLEDYITGSYRTLRKVIQQYPKTAPYFAKMTHGESLNQIFDIVK